MTALTLDANTLLEHIETLGNIGLDRLNGGRSRIALTDAEKLGRDQVVSWMKAQDLVVHIDEIGNIFGILPDQSGNTKHKALMIGSHIDSVFNAGALDGCYGVIAGLAVTKAFRDEKIIPSRPIIVAAFTNEEGVRYQPDMMGSLAHAGGLSAEQVLNSVGTDGTRLGDELQRIGYNGDMPLGTLVPSQYLELHIEQGPVLDKEGIKIGAVSNLQGISWQKIHIKGKANHAGTTPMSMRHDAGYAAASVMTFLRDVTRSKPGTLATVGSIKFEPNAINVIPRAAEFTVDLRNPDNSTLYASEQALTEYLEVLSQKEGVTIETEVLAGFDPVIFDENLVDAIEQAANALNIPHRRMTSGAGHDAQMIARIAPSAMIFVPSKDGISHNPKEFTEAEDLIQGAKVLLATVAALLSPTQQ
ncbi:MULTISPECIES: Zn-dependent hydrolase [Vibrio]|uniref:Zn-dependent hydrolase n=1 Tax=Vibrio TaxID=662 RepID=UPI000243C043|nr:Zn-dependent hydrolase [Vibrio sp. EJY3]AEX24607.1 allantoate amidohydrolase [Vibrio sp. EJY3]